MTLLTIVISLAAPSLGGFFRGRSLDSEARRLLALTRYGQSRAAAEGVPMVLWFDETRRAYGLEAEASYEPDDSGAVEYALEKDLQFELLSADLYGSLAAMPGAASGSSPRLGLSSSLATMPGFSQGPANLLRQGLPRIRFLPDGSLDPLSPPGVRLYDRDEISRWLVPSSNRLTYELRTPTNLGSTTSR
jgi:hypothetical protein